MRSASPESSSEKESVIMLKKMYGRLILPTLARIRAFCGISPGQPTQPTPTTTLPEELAVAVVLKAAGDATLRASDLAHPGEHYIAAIRMYGDALACVVGSTVDHAGRETGRNPAHPAAEVIERAAAELELSATRIESALCASAHELLCVPSAERRPLALAIQQICSAVIGSRIASAELGARRELQRVTRNIVTLLGAVGFASLAVQYWHVHGDLARGKTWRASSELVNCRPIAKGGCAGRPSIFFHTKEEQNPWIEYDLGVPTKLSRVIVENATDGLRERAIPLVVEISDNQKDWSEVARITRTFESWTPSFPEVSARYVRFRAARVTYLHLSQIEIRH
jgi:hypothetical protein